MNKNLASSIEKVLCASPIEVFDEDSNTVMSTELWELVTVRCSGPFKDSRVIGSANIVTAYNLVYLNSLCSSNEQKVFEQFTEIIGYLVETRIIRKNPNRIRKTFKVI